MTRHDFTMFRYSLFFHPGLSHGIGTPLLLLVVGWGDAIYLAFAALITAVLWVAILVSAWRNRNTTWKWYQETKEAESYFNAQ